MRWALVACAVAACDGPTSPFDCPVRVLLAAPGTVLAVDSLRGVHDSDSLSILPGDTVAVIGLPCTATKAR